MKLKVIDRILMALYAFLGLLALAILCACVLWPEIYALNLTNLMLNACSKESGKIIGCVLIAVLAAGLIHLIAVAFRKDARGPKSSVSVQNTDSGAVRVSVQAMDAMVRRAIGDQEGVLGFKSRIVNHDDSITVHVDMSVAMDSHIPNITMTMQRRIKRYIEETSGIAVREVVVLVSEVREAPLPVVPVPVPAENAEQPAAEEAAAEDAVVEEAVVEEPAAEEAVCEEAACAEAEAVEEEAEEEIPGDLSETDELIAMEEAAEMEEAAVLEEVLTLEPEAEAAEEEAEEAVAEAVEAVEEAAEEAALEAAENAPQTEAEVFFAEAEPEENPENKEKNADA